MVTNQLVQYIKENIPFYKQSKFHDYIHIEQFPFITKHMIREDYGRFISDELGGSKAQLVSFLDSNTSRTKGWYNEVETLNDLIIEETSGTTGIPFLCAKTRQERTKLALHLWKERRKRDSQLTRENYFQFSHIGIGMKNPNAYDYNLDHLIQLYAEIKEKRIRWIHGTPNALINHIKVFKENGIFLELDDLKYIECTGTFLREEDRKTIEEYFRVKVINLYGSIETWPIAMTCNHNIMHLIEDNIYLELIDLEGNVITEPYQVGRVVVTTLKNRIFPFVRYVLGDYAQYINPDYCADGCRGRCIEVLEGRESNIIKGLSTTKFGNKEFSRIVATAKLEFPDLDLRYIKIMQLEADKFEILLNKFNESYKFVNKIREIMEREFEKPLIIQEKYLEQNEIVDKKYEKPNIFVCLY